MICQLDESHHPAPVKLEIRPGAQEVAAVERELRDRAASDAHRCCGYFPALAGDAEIISDLPACRAFAARVPFIWHRGYRYEFNFLRLSSVQQSEDASYHLDSDAGTALTGDVAALSRREVRRLLLNLSADSERCLHYLDLDPGSVALAVDGSYIRAADPEALRAYGLVATIPRRDGRQVHGLVFASNRVLHSGVDDARGHFVAAYGVETAVSESAPVGDLVSNELST